MNKHEQSVFTGTDLAVAGSIVAGIVSLAILLLGFGAFVLHIAAGYIT